ncbi:MAG: 50S ribosomal protein L6 [Candidatus Pacebacteria bacterium]|nr:50S ribosomal protein L6 [Candidatus Paceibacterota bacterium]
MSRLGKQPVTVPSGVEIKVDAGTLTVKGPKGELSRPVVTEAVKFDITEGEVTLTPANETQHARALWGTYASHLRNMVTGVTDGFKKELEIEGVGYRAEAQGQKLVLNVGFSHPVEMEVPQGITATVEKNLITIEGHDKEAVGQFAANVRAVKKPEPYKGKGIHYVGEYIIRKQGKKAVA